MNGECWANEMLHLQVTSHCTDDVILAISSPHIAFVVMAEHHGSLALT
jgi:hypothetical protein